MEIERPERKPCPVCQPFGCKCEEDHEEPTFTKAEVDKMVEEAFFAGFDKGYEHGDDGWIDYERDQAFQSYMSEKETEE